MEIHGKERDEVVNRLKRARGQIDGVHGTTFTVVLPLASAETTSLR